MTTFINARFLCQPLSGVQRFATEILGALDRHLTSDPALAKAVGPIKALHPIGVLRQPKWKHIFPSQIGRTRGHVWEQGALLKASKAGVLVSLGNAGPLFHPAQMVALHDANIWEIPDAFSPLYKLVHKTMRPLLAKRAKQVLTVSHFSATTLSKRLGIDVSKFAVIPNGANHILDVTVDRSILKENKLLRNEYLLSVGNLSPNKNIKKLIQAHAIAGASVPPLVVVGGTVSGIETQRLAAASNVQFLGRVSDGSLRALYEDAAGFVFPSLHEGFGIPPLEAMQLGTPVLASDRTALPEILRDGAMYFDPSCVEDMASRLGQFANISEGDRSDLIDRGFKVSANFTWEKSAQLLAQQILALKATISNDALVVHTKHASQKQRAS